MKKLPVLIAALIAFGASSARAVEPVRKLDVAPFVGAYVPTGSQRDTLKDAVLVGVTASYDVLPNLAVLGTFGWAPTSAKGLAQDDDVDLFQYDLGVQYQVPFALRAGWTVAPFAGVGAGARTYNFRHGDADAETDFAGYVSAGAAAQYRMLEARLTARDYLSAYDGLQGERDTSARNDLGLFASVGFRF